MRSLLLPRRASMIALSLGSRSSSFISSFCRKIWVWLLTEMVNGSLFCSSALAWLCGRSSGTPTVKSGADTMNTINNTNMTSTNGVTLISLMTGRRRRLFLPPAAAMLMLPAAISCPYPPPSAPLVDLPRQDRGEFIGKAFEPLGLPVHLTGEFIVKNRRRDGGNEANCGGKQSFCNAGRDHRERRVLRRRDRLKAGHDTGHGAEQADKRTGRTDRRQHQQLPFHVLDLAGDGDLHDLLDAHLQSGERADVAFEAALPFAHRRNKQCAGRLSRLGGQRLIEVLKRLARPERFLEMVAGTAQPREQQRLVDRDLPHPDRAKQQPRHH